MSHSADKLIHHAKAMLGRAHAVEADYEPVRARLGTPYVHEGIRIPMMVWHPEEVAGRRYVTVRPADVPGASALGVLKGLKGALSEIYADLQARCEKDTG